MNTQIRLITRGAAGLSALSALAAVALLAACGGGHDDETAAKKVVADTSATIRVVTAVVQLVDQISKFRPITPNVFEVNFHAHGLHLYLPDDPCLPATGQGVFAGNLFSFREENGGKSIPRLLPFFVKCHRIFVGVAVVSGDGLGCVVFCHNYWGCCMQLKCYG